MRIRIAVIKTENGEYQAYGSDSATDTELITYIKDDIDNIEGDVYFIEVDLPEKPPTLVGEVVL